MILGRAYVYVDPESGQIFIVTKLPPTKPDSATGPHWRYESGSWVFDSHLSPENLVMYNTDSLRFYHKGLKKLGEL